MSLEQFITKFLNVKATQIQKLTTVTCDDDGDIELKVRMVPKKEVCPLCGSPVVTHGYYARKLNHAVFSNRKCTIVYEQRRYRCKQCEYTFHESNPFINSSEGLTYETKFNILTTLKEPEATYSSVARHYNLSPTKVAQLFDKCVNISRKPLPEVLSMDEHYFPESDFDSLYCCLLMDFRTGIIVDVLPDRRQEYVSNYFDKIKMDTLDYTTQKSELDNVKYISMDLHEPFRRIADIYFPNALVCADGFHVIKNLTDCFRQVLIDCRRNAPTDVMQYLLTKFRYVFNHGAYLDNKGKYNKRLGRYVNYRELRDMMLAAFPKLAKAYQLKEYYIMMNSKTRIETAAEDVDKAIELFSRSGIKEYETFATTLYNWRTEIINSFTLIGGKRVNNSYIEAKNRVLERLLFNANGYRNFTRARNRILYCLNKDDKFTLV
jgi:transposase